MLTEEQIAKLLTSTENLKQTLQTMRSAAQKHATTNTQLITSLEGFEKSMINSYSIFQKNLQNPDYRGAPLQQHLQALDQARKVIRKYVQCYTTIIPLAQELDEGWS